MTPMVGLGFAALFLVRPPVEATVPVEALPFEPAAWKAMATTKLEVVEDGRTVVYGGVPLAIVLKDHLKGPNRMRDLRALVDAAILLNAKDDYHAVVSAAAVAMDPDGKKYLLAFTKDGQPLAEDRGPAELIVPGDTEHVRWIWQIASLNLVHLKNAAKAGR
jgi:hypothetical protein